MRDLELLESLNPNPEHRGNPGPVTVRARRTARLLPAAAVLAVAITASIVGGSVLSRDDARVDLETARQPEPTTEPAAEPEPTSDAESPAAITFAVRESVTPCDSGELAQAIADSRGDILHKPTQSPGELAEVSPIIVRGTVISVEPNEDGATISYKLRDSSDMDRARIIQRLWVPFDSPPLAQGTQFVAFLTGDTVTTALPTAPVQPASTSAYVTNPEGFWVACDSTSPAVSVIAEPVEPGWEPVLADGISLDQLWVYAQFPQDEVVTTVRPSVEGAGRAVYDLQLVTGERFRLSLPATLGGELTMTERPGDIDPLLLVGDAATIVIRYQDDCPIAATPATELGVRVRITDRTAVVCRPQEPLVMTIGSTSTVDLTLASNAAEFMDIVPIERGRRFGSLFWSGTQDTPNCSSCPPFGPAIFAAPEAVAVYRVSDSAITAFNLTDLSERWKFFGTDPVRLHWSYQQSVIVEFVGGGLARLDAASGDMLWQSIWQVQQAPEADLRLSSYRDDLWLVQSHSQNNQLPPSVFLRSIDMETGDIGWTTSTARSSWVPDRPVVIDGVVLTLAEEIRPTPLEPEFHLDAFNVENGERLWSRTFDTPGPSVQPESLAVVDFEEGRAVIVSTAEGDLVRIEPTTGDLLWSVRTGAAGLSGTAFAADGALAIDLTTPTGRLLIDPATGARAPDA